MNLSLSRSQISFREKSAWISLAVLLVVFIPYFLNVFRLFGAGLLSAGAVMGLFIAATIVVILLSATFHILLAVFGRVEPPDERDRAIELKSFRIAYGILTVSVFCLIGTVVIVALPSAQSPPRAALGPVFLSQLFFLCFVLGEAAKYFTQAVCYRRGS
jgi:4-hydroxybenzoate polyprenyltransferase